ncbi:MAG TPA: histidine kinase [Vicinamibacterales bacterium]|nr:histidine kinase [Vicinamibacterales bacterium]
MKPPADRRLDFHGAGTDQPVTCPPRRYGLRWSVAFAAAVVLSVISSTLAWQLSASLGKDAAPWGTIVALNGAYWFAWALFTPLIVWLSQHFRFERQGIVRAVAVHLPSVAVFSLGHIAAMGGVQWWLATAHGRQFQYWTEVQRAALQYFDWEMMTYWAIVGLSHAVLYYRESRDRAVCAARLEAQLVEARLKALQQQLHPHFLFNTLHAISALMHKDVEAADRTLMRLSDLLRVSLEHTGQQEITLKAELDFLTRYLQIEQTRFADRLVVRFDVAPEALDGLVPNLILQPLVENAIKHGVARKAGPGRVDISARRDGDKLVMEVRDDGVGLSEDALTALQKGIGVSTTRARLQHLFGADYRFEFHRQPTGLSVLVALPWRPGGEPTPELVPAPESTGPRQAAGNMRAVGRVTTMARQHS